MAVKAPGAAHRELPQTPERAAWLKRLPETLRNLERRWSLTLDAPFDGEEVSLRLGGAAALAGGASAVLKVGSRIWKASMNCWGLRFWDGNPTVEVLEADEELGAMLMERCEPGTALAHCRNSSRM